MKIYLEIKESKFENSLNKIPDLKTKTRMFCLLTAVRERMTRRRIRIVLLLYRLFFCFLFLTARVLNLFHFSLYGMTLARIQAIKSNKPGNENTNK